MLVLVLCLTAQLACAFDITTTDGHVYRGCSVKQVEPDALRIMHADGAARISYDKLPPALQKQYFDPAEVAAYREQVAVARHAAEEAAAARAVEERRARAIATAQAQEQRERAESARQQQQMAQREREQMEKADAQTAESLRQATERRKRIFIVGIVGLGIVLSIFVYFLPSIIGRHKANAMAIFTLNLFLGWTFFGWVIALVWACTQDSAMEQLARERMNMPAPPPRPYGTFGGRQVEEGRTLESGGRYLE